MKKSRLALLFITSVIACSCSKSLTDLGYPSGSTTTVKAESAGNGLGERWVDWKGLGAVPGVENFNERRSRESIWGYDSAQAVMEINRQCAAFINEFYRGLNTEPLNEKKFMRKYGRLMSDSVKVGIKRYGLQMFMDSSTKGADSLVVTPLKARWFLVKGTGRQQTNLLLKVKKPNPRSKILLMGVSNPEKNIELFDMSPVKNRLIIISGNQ